MLCEYRFSRECKRTVSSFPDGKQVIKFWQESVEPGAQKLVCHVEYDGKTVLNVIIFQNIPMQSFIR